MTITPINKGSRRMFGKSSCRFPTMYRTFLDLWVCPSLSKAETENVTVVPLGCLGIAASYIDSSSIIVKVLGSLPCIV